MSVVFVVDDDPSMRKSLQFLIESVHLQVRAFETAQQFLAAFSGDHPGCLVLDVRLPGLSGLDLQDQLRERGIDIPIVFITGHGDVSTAVRAMKGSAFDFIEKPFKDQVLLDRIHRALALDAERRAEQTRTAEMVARLSSLSPREREVLDLVIAGHSNRSIAGRLKLSEKTIEAHRARVTQKMGATNLASLVRIALAAQSASAARPAARVG